MKIETDEDQIVEKVHNAAFAAIDELLTVLLNDRKLPERKQLLSESDREAMQRVRVKLQEALRRKGQNGA